MKKLLLLILFLGGCSTIESNRPSDTLINLIGGKHWQFTATLPGEENATTYTFTISTDADFYIDNTTVLSYVDGNDNGATYEGTFGNTLMTIRLSNVSETGGLYSSSIYGVPQVVESDFTLVVSSQ